MGLMESLAMGLRNAGGVASEHTYDRQNKELDDNKLMLERRRTLMLSQLIKGVEAGAIDPEKAKPLLQKLGYPELSGAISATPEAQAQQMELRNQALLNRAYEVGGQQGYLEVLKRVKPKEYMALEAQIRTSQRPIAAPRNSPGYQAWNPKTMTFEYQPNPNYVPEGEKKPNSQKEYEYALTKGYKGTYEDWVKFKGKSSSPTITINPANPTGAADVADIRQTKITARQNSAFLSEASGYLSGIETAPGATGIRGAVAVPVSGLVEQIFGKTAGDAVSQAIAGASPEKVRDLRSWAVLLRAKLMPIVTNENGRFTETERQQATEAQAALDVAQGPSQVAAATKLLAKVGVRDLERNMKTLNAKPQYDLSTEEGFKKQAQAYIKSFKLTPEEAVALVRDVKQIRSGDGFTR